MLDIIKEVSKEELKDFLYNIDLTDENLYGEINSRDYFGIFQFNGGSAEPLVKKIHPDNFEEMVAINSLARPGTIDFADEYNSNKTTKASRYPKKVSELIKTTYNVILFQEQVMNIFNKIGGFTLEETNEVRSLMKKLGKADKKQSDLDKWDSTVNRFIDGAVKDGISQGEARALADDLLKMSGYSFNRCFSGDMVIDRDNWKNSPLTIKEMYLVMNDKVWAKNNGHKALHYKYKREGYGKCYSYNNDGRLRLNKIIGIYFQGKKNVYKITLENGSSITVTSNHKFPIIVNNKIEEKTIDDGISIGVELIINSGYEKTKEQWRKYSFSNTKANEIDYKKYKGCGFKFGKENSAYINGEFSKFRDNKKELLEKANSFCQICFAENKRLECHHKDGDRKNNEIENLIICCPSCHKKLDYSMFRTKKGEKGLATKTSRIVSIEKMEEEDVFDVEMENPYHTLSVNKIIASNSHAVAYSYIAAMTLYMSYYFRPYYYSSTLTYENERQKALLDRLNSCKQHGFKIYPPDVNRSMAHFAPDDDGIRFGLNEIKFVGENPAKIIIDKRPYASVFDFIVKTKDRCMNKKVITALISMGAFDELINKQRKKYLLIVEKYYERKASIKVEERLLALWNKIEEEVERFPGLEMTDGDFVNFEETYLGFNFFHSLFTDKVVNLIYELNKRGMCETSFEDVPDYAVSARVPISINTFRTIVDKNGREMAFIDGSDMYGIKKSFPIFQSYWKIIKDKITGKGIYLMNFFVDEEKKELYYGSKKWTDDATKSRMVKKII